MVAFTVLLLLGSVTSDGRDASAFRLAQSENPTILAQSENPTGRVGPGLSAPPGQPPYVLRQGPAVSLGGNGPSQTLVIPGGGTATATPNGNGTATVTHADGRTEIVNMPR